MRETWLLTLLEMNAPWPMIEQVAGGLRNERLEKLLSKLEPDDVWAFRGLLHQAEKPQFRAV